MRHRSKRNLGWLGSSLYQNACMHIHTSAYYSKESRDTPPNSVCGPQVRGPCYRQQGAKAFREESYMARCTFQKISERRQQMKGRMSGWVHWDHPQELLVGNHKGKVPGGQRQGPMGSCQLEALAGEQRSSSQEVP